MPPKYCRSRPCSTCPFLRDDVPDTQPIRHLRPASARNIADTLLGDLPFTCHKDNEKAPGARKHCTGAAIVLEKLSLPNQAMRIAERLQMYDPSELGMLDQVFDNFDEWIEANNKGDDDGQAAS